MKTASLLSEYLESSLKKYNCMLSDIHMYYVWFIVHEFLDKTVPCQKRIQNNYNAVQWIYDILSGHDSMSFLINHITIELFK